MADQNGKTADGGDEGWEDLPDGVIRLTEEEVREVRAMLARDRTPGRAYTLEALGVSARVLDAVTVHGAPSSVVDVVHAQLTLLRGEEGPRQPPLPYKRLFRRVAADPHGRAYPERIAE